MKDTYPNKVGLAPTATAGSGNATALIFNKLMNLLIKILVRLGILKKDLDYHLVRASMVIIYFFFGYQKWFPYEAQGLIPFFKNGPLISWMYPVFGVQGSSWFLGVSEWLFGALLFLGFWNKKLGILGAVGSCVTLYHDYHHHPIHARRLECSGRRLSGDAGQCRFPYEGSSSLRRVSLFAQAGCRESVSFGEFSKRHLDLSKTYGPFKTVWTRKNM